MPTWTAQSKNPATATAQSKTSLSIAEVDALFMDGAMRTFMDGTNKVYLEASTNSWTAQSKT